MVDRWVLITFALFFNIDTYFYRIIKDCKSFPKIKSFSFLLQFTKAIVLGMQYFN